MSYTPEKRAEARFEPYAECAADGCDWGTDKSRLARTFAKTHVRSTGHRVRVIVEAVALWGPKETTND